MNRSELCQDINPGQCREPGAGQAGGQGGQEEARAPVHPPGPHFLSLPAQEVIGLAGPGEGGQEVGVFSEEE